MVEVKEIRNRESIEHEAMEGEKAILEAYGTI